MYRLAPAKLANLRKHFPGFNPELLPFLTLKLFLIFFFFFSVGMYVLTTRGVSLSTELGACV